ncbi:MAG: sigma-54-dependent Fis family transcriptional regulator [Pirellulales bacterium]|nr:sigma-54-dependent Fis family transcriptional regulator [Pirellulales bacterium]
MDLSTQEARLPRIVGVSKAIREVLRLIDSVASSDCCVLLEGESGTGKELLARRLSAKSRRWNQPMIPVNCAGISPSLFESQFFGHVRGAFTGAEQHMLGLVRTADGGTLFLDEVAEIPYNLQPKLLRVIQEQEVMPVGHPIPVKVNTRFIAGTNRDLREMVRRGEFRKDLYYRLNIVRVTVPPLRDRPEDIPPLLDHFCEHYARRYDSPSPAISSAVRSVLMCYPWPGNVRELAAWVERLFATGLEPEVLAEMLLVEAESPREEVAPDELSLKKLERRAIVQAMDLADSNQRKAARLLQVHRATLARKLKKHKLT